MIKIASDLELPAEALTQTFAILAKRGMGKTYTAKVFTEEFRKAGLPVIVIDPIGVWWGLRSSADGKAAGLEIVIAGGEHADVPIEPTGGEVLAEFVVETGVSMVIDLSLFRKGEQVKFMTAFAETLYRKNRTAVHLVLDEADAFAPQRPAPGEQRMLGAIEDIVRRGRARGIGVTMITQRPAVLNKNVLTQIEVLVALRLTAPLDQKAVDEWVKTHAEEGQREKFMASLPSLPVGTAWLWSPGWLNIFQKVKIRKLTTLDTSSTPKAGAKVVEARVMADVGLDQLRERLAATIEKVEAEDPKALKRRVAELEKQLASAKPKVEVREVVPDHIIVSVQMVMNAYEQMGQYIANLKKYMPQLFVEQITDFKLSDKHKEIMAALGDEVPDMTLRPHSRPRKPPLFLGNPTEPPKHPKMQGFHADTIIIDEMTDKPPLNKAERALLTTLAQFPEGRTPNQLAILSHYSRKSSSFRNALGSLRSAGMAEGKDPILITEAGRQVLGKFDPVPTGEALLDYWLGKLGKAESQVLTAVYHRPRADKETVAAMAEYSPVSSSFRNALGKLRTLGLITGSDTLTASPELYD